MPKPVCVKCGLFFTPTHNGICITEGMPIVTPSGAGKANAENWRAYKCWRADEWTCRGCGFVLITGFAHKHYAEHYEPNFEEVQKATVADKTWVYDC